MYNHQVKQPLRKQTTTPRIPRVEEVACSRIQTSIPRTPRAEGWFWPRAGRLHPRACARARTATPGSPAGQAHGGARGRAPASPAVAGRTAGLRAGAGAALQRRVHPSCRRRNHSWTRGPRWPQPRGAPAAGETRALGAGEGSATRLGLELRGGPPDLPGEWTTGPPDPGVKGSRGEFAERRSDV